MLFTLVFALLALFGLVFLGNAMGRGFSLPAFRNPFLALWIGLACAGLFVQLAALFLPVHSPMILGALGVAALFGIAPAIRSFRDARGPCFRQFCLALALMALLVYPAILFQPWPPYALYDTELYHAGAISFLGQYGFLPGLGNLHHRLGQPSMWLALAALLDVGALSGRVIHVMPLVLHLGASLYFLYASIGPGNFYARVFSAIILFMILVLAGNEYFSLPNLYYDQPALILCCVALNEALGLLGEKRSARDQAGKLAIVFMLLAASFMVKPLIGPMIIASCFMLAILLKRGAITIAGMGRILFYPALAGLCWVISNIILSGYPVFPMGIFPLPLDWTMPGDEVARNRQAVQGWARMPGPEYLKALQEGVGYWLGPWLGRTLAMPVWWFSVYLPFIAGALYWTLAICQKRLDRIKLAFLAIIALQMCYWFWQHPDYRFGGGIFWAFFGLGLAFCLKRSERTLKTCARCVVFGIVVIGSFHLYALWTDKIHAQWAKGALWAYLEQRITALPPAQGTFAGVAKKTLHENGPDEFAIYYPAGETDLCGNSPLPCTPYPDERLHMRDPGDMGSGFLIRWQ